MNKKTKKITAPNRHRARNRTLVILALVASLIAGYVVYSNYQAAQQAARNQQLNAQDKQRFEIVRKKVETLHARLQAAADPGTTWTLNTACGQGSTKIEEPLKGCGIGTSTKVVVESEGEAIKLIEKYQSVFKQASDLFVHERDYRKRPPDFPAALREGLDGAAYRERDSHVMQRFV